MNLTPKQKEVVERLEEGYIIDKDYWYEDTEFDYRLTTIKGRFVRYLNKNTITSLIKKGIIDKEYKLIKE